MGWAASGTSEDSLEKLLVMQLVDAKVHQRKQSGQAGIVLSDAHLPFTCQVLLCCWKQSVSKVAWWDISQKGGFLPVNNWAAEEANLLSELYMEKTAEYQA